MEANMGAPGAPSLSLHGLFKPVLEETRASSRANPSTTPGDHTQLSSQLKQHKHAFPFKNGTSSLHACLSQHDSLKTCENEPI